MNFIYENDRYGVVLLSSEVEDGYDLPINDNYGVFNKDNEVIEASTANLPQAYVLADQFDMILERKLHKVWAEQEAGISELSPLSLAMSDESTH